MAYTIVFSSEAAKDIKRLDRVVQKRLHKKFVEISTVTTITKVAKKLVNFEAGEYRLRVGDYRIIFDIDGKNIFVLRVRHRKDVYR